MENETLVNKYLFFMYNFLYFYVNIWWGATPSLDNFHVISGEGYNSPPNILVLVAPLVGIIWNHRKLH